MIVFWFKQVLDRGPEQRESKMTVLCPLIIIIFISYIIIYYIIIIIIIKLSNVYVYHEVNTDFVC